MDNILHLERLRKANVNANVNANANKIYVKLNLEPYTCIVMSALRNFSNKNSILKMSAFITKLAPIGSHRSVFVVY